MSIHRQLVAIETRLSSIEARLRAVPVLADQDIALPGQRLPHFWGDVDVRHAVLARYRQMTVRQARDEITAAFGPARTPSHSAIHRVWQRLDKIKKRATT